MIPFLILEIVAGVVVLIAFTIGLLPVFRGWAQRQDDQESISEECREQLDTLERLGRECQGQLDSLEHLARECQDRQDRQDPQDPQG